MRRSLSVVAVVCIAAFAVAAIAAAPALALLDAQTPVQPLFGEVCQWAPPAVPEAPLPSAPSLDVHSPRPPPLRHA